MCNINQSYQFREFRGSKEYERHLVNLGLVSGVVLYIVSKEVGQPFIVVFRGTRIGLDEAIASEIFVEPTISSDYQEIKVMNQLAIGEKGTVAKILGTGPVKRRLMDMGITRGTKVEIIKFAPLGDPIEIRLRNYELTLRKNEAEMILVESHEGKDDGKTDCCSW